MKPAATETIVTRMNVAASAQRVWNSLMFYESVEGVPPLHLRLLLPRPIRTQGSKSNVGDQATCLYDGGHLLKRVTMIERNRQYEFAVVEQKLIVGIGVRLSGGCYSLSALPDGGTELSITTHYSSSNRPRWLVRPAEVAACHMFHRYLLGAIRRKAEAGIPVPATETAPDSRSNSG